MRTQHVFSREEFGFEPYPCSRGDSVCELLLSVPLFGFGFWPPDSTYMSHVVRYTVYNTVSSHNLIFNLLVIIYFCLPHPCLVEFSRNTPQQSKNDELHSSPNESKALSTTKTELPSRSIRRFRQDPLKSVERVWRFRSSW